MKVKISEITINKEYLPRMTIHSDTINRYKEAYEIGEELPPIVVQKENKILIDGFHRYEAQKKLRREEVEVILLDIPEDQIYIEAVRRVGEHGLPPNDNDVGEQIYNLRVKYGLSYREIGVLVKKHETTVSRRIKEDHRFKVLDLQDTEIIDKRTKYYNPKEIVSRLESGEKGVDIASDIGISPATVTLVKKKAEENQALLNKSPVVICLDGRRLRDVFRLTTLGGDIEANFQKDALYITAKRKREADLEVFARFSKDYFDSYSVKTPLTWFVNAPNVMPMFKLKSVSEADYAEMILNVDKLDMKFEGWGGGSTYSTEKIEVGDRPVNSAFNYYDEQGVLTERTCVLRVGSLFFKGMPESDGKAILKFEDGVLSIQGVSRGWRFEKNIPIEESKGENVQIMVGNNEFKKITSGHQGGFNLFIVDDEKKYVMTNILGKFYYVNHVVSGAKLK